VLGELEATSKAGTGKQAGRDGDGVKRRTSVVGVDGGGTVVGLAWECGSGVEAGRGANDQVREPWPCLWPAWEYGDA